MKDQWISALVDGGIALLAGVYMTLLGHRVVGKRPGENAKYDEWYQRFGPMIKFLGPFVAVFGIIQMARSILMPQQ